MEHKNKRSVNVRAVIFIYFFLILLGFAGAFLLVKNQFNHLEKFETIELLAYQNTDNIQKIVLYSKQVLEKREIAKTLMTGSISLLEYNIETLKKGGQVNVDSKIKTLPPSETEALPLITEIENAWKPFKTEAEIIVTESLNKDSTVVSEKTKLLVMVPNARVLQAGAQLEKTMEMLVALNQQFAEKNREIATKKRNQANANTWLLLFANVTLVGVGFVFIQRRILRPLNKIKNVVQMVNKGDLNTKLDVDSGNEVGDIAETINVMLDKIKNATDFVRSIEKGDLNVSYSLNNGMNSDKDMLALALIDMREKMKHVAEEENERNWTTKGFAMFGEIMQTHPDDTTALSYEIISNLVKYLNANQGALFLVNDENLKADVTLDLIACYAFNRRRYIQKTINAGEGLAGQAYKDADTIYLTDIPDNYVDITSGLGGSKPRSVLVIPLKLSDRIYGIMEFASFGEFKPYQVLFLQRLSENIASNLYAARANEKNKILFVETNAKAEQLRLSEMETRKYLQALEKAQEAMQLNSEALESQSAAIRSTLIYLEVDMNRIILNCNDLFLKTTKYTYEEVIGKDHQMIVPPNPSIQKSYERMWTDMRAGIYRYGEFLRVDKYGKEFWLRSTYTPVKDKNGVPYKIIQLAFDVTEDKKLRLDFKEQLDSFKRSSIIVEYSIDGIILDANDNFLEMMEYNLEEIVGQTHTIFVSDKYKYAKDYLAIWRKLAQGQFHTGEIRRQTKKGREVWFQGSFNPILDLNGKPYKIIEFIIDMTERKNAEKRILAAKDELQIKESNLTALINNTDDMIYTIGKNYRVNLMNESARKFFESLGGIMRVSSNVLDAIPRNYYHVWKSYYDRSLEGEKFSIEQAIFSEAMNQKFYLSMSFNPILSDKEEVIGVSVFSRDITNRKQREIDFADFTNKQSQRTTRLIDAQKKIITDQARKFEQEKEELTEKINGLESVHFKNNIVIDYLSKVDALSFTLNQYLEIELYNELTGKIYRLWNLYIQPEYCLLDTFTNQNFYHFKSVLERCLNGDEFSDILAFPNKKLHKILYFSVSIKALRSKGEPKLVITAKEVSQVIENEKAKQRQIREKLKTQTFKQLKNQEKNYFKSIGDLGIQLKQLETTLDNQRDTIFLYEHSREGVFKMDREWMLIGYNQKAKELFSLWSLYLQPEYHLPDIFPFKKFDEWSALCKKAFQGESLEWDEYVVNRRLKKIFVLNIRLLPEIDPNGEVIHLILLVQDQSRFGTEARRSEKQKPKMQQALQSVYKIINN